MTEDERGPLPPSSQPRRNRDELRASLTAVGIIATLTLFLYLVRSILLPFVIAGILAYVCTPPVDWLTRRFRAPRWLFAIAVLLALMAVAAAVGYLAWPALHSEIARLGKNLHGTIERFVGQFVGDKNFTVLGETLSAGNIADRVTQSIHHWFGQPGAIIRAAALGFAGMFGFILAWVLTGYFLIDADRIRAGLFWLVPPHHRPFVHRVWSGLNPVLRRYFVGVGLIVVYASTAAYVGLGLILGLQHAVLLAVMTGFLEVIPVIGPAASAVIAGLVAVEEAKSSWGIIAYVIYATALRISIDEFFGPIVLGRAAYIPPVLVIFCFLSGGILFGVVGIVLAIPVALTIKATLNELYEEEGDANADHAPPA